MRLNPTKLLAVMLLGGVFVPLAWWQGGAIGRGASEDATQPSALQVGKCFNAESGATLTGIGPVGCDTRHEYEVIGLGRITAATFDSGALAAEADAICISAFEAYVGHSLAVSSLDATHITPSAESWDRGDRGVVCLVADPAGPTTGSVAASGD